MQELLKAGERLDYVNDHLSLLQKIDGLSFGTDALLLAGFIKKQPYRKVAEFGGGTGIISMLLATRQKALAIDCYEVQKAYVDLMQRNFKGNGLEEKIQGICRDITERKSMTAGFYDMICTNPPYMRCDGLPNLHEEKNIARHEVYGNIKDFVATASYALRFGGAFYVVYRPDRLVDLFSAMREYEIEPKRLRMVYASETHTPSMVLVEGRRGGKPDLLVEPPFIIYGKDSKTHTQAMENLLLSGEMQ